MTASLSLDLDRLDFDKGGGLVSVVVQDSITDAVLMVAYADREALQRTLETREMHFHSRSRGRLWRKGESSGNVLRVVELSADCDGDTVLARCSPAGPTCHTGAPTCFGEPVSGDALRALSAVVAARASAMQRAPVAEGAGDPAARPSYTQRLLADRNLRLKKLGEEVAELIVAIADEDRPRAAEEGADVIYHLVVALQAAGVSFDEVRAVLAKRAG